jgi:hypothetical protein
VVLGSGPLAFHGLMCEWDPSRDCKDPFLSTGVLFCSLLSEWTDVAAVGSALKLDPLFL